jgi:hypothetical protein
MFICLLTLSFLIVARCEALFDRGCVRFAKFDVEATGPPKIIACSARNTPSQIHSEFPRPLPSK